MIIQNGSLKTGSKGYLCLIGSGGTYGKRLSSKEPIF